MEITVMPLYGMWVMSFGIIVGLAAIILMVWAIVDLVGCKLPSEQKLLWLLIILLLPLIGAILYIALAKEIGKGHSRVGVSGKHLTRSTTQRMIAGVCGGLGEYMGVDPTVVRLLWIVLTVLTGFWIGILIYLIAWIIIPEGRR